MKGNLKKLALYLPALFFVALAFGMPSIASAADRYWVGGGGFWSDDTNHWATSSGGAPGGGNLPTSTTNCVFDANSFSGTGQVVTISTTADCLDMDWTGVGSDNPVLVINSGQQLNNYGALTLSAGMTFAGPSSFILFRAPSAAGPKFITSNGVTLNTNIVFFNNGTYQLFDNLSTRNLYLNGGTFDANNFDVTADGFSSSNSLVRTLNMGSGTWIMNGTGTVWDITDSTNMTLNAGASTLVINDTTGSQKDFSGGGLTYQDLDFNGRNIVIHDGNVYNTFNVNNAGLADALFVENGTTQNVITNFTTNGSSGNLAAIQAFTPGTPFTLNSYNGYTFAVDYMTIGDSDATGGAWYAGANSGNGGGNSGWIFSAPPTDRYWVGGTGNWDGTDTTHWSYDSGGAGGASAPTSVNSVFFDANSFSGPGQTVTITTTDQSTLDMTWTSADTPTLDLSGAGRHLNVYGSVVLAAGMTVTGSGGDAILLYASSPTYGITSNGVTIDTNLYIQGGAGYILQDNLYVKNFHLFLGSFDANNFAVTLDTFESSNTNSRQMYMRGGTWTLNGTVGGVWTITDPTNMTLDPGGSTIDIADTGALEKNFYGGGLTYHTLDISGDNVLIADSSTFDTLDVDNAGFPNALFIQNGTTQTVNNFRTNGASGNLARIQAYTPGTPFTLSKTTGTVSVDWMVITDSGATGGATWYAGANSTDGTGNTGWIFGTPPAPIAAPIAGTYTSTQSVTLSSPGSSSIWYTTNGSTPDCSVGTLYAGAFSVATSETVKAVACFGVGSSPSAVGSFAYVITHPSGGGGSFLPGASATPTPTPMPTFSPTPGRGDPANLPRLGLHEGEVVGDTDPNDPDVFIVNVWGYKRLFLNPVIYSFYGHLSALAGVTHITPPSRDSLPTSGLFRNCETQDKKVYALEVTGEDTGVLHWVNISGDQAVLQDPDFFKKDFCINTREFNWYTLSPVAYTSLSQLPVYRR